jgi:hypothetical protein
MFEGWLWRLENFLGAANPTGSSEGRARQVAGKWQIALSCLYSCSIISEIYSLGILHF